jgi:hypothetical protein
MAAPLGLEARNEAISLPGCVRGSPATGPRGEQVVALHEPGDLLREKRHRQLLAGRQGKPGAEGARIGTYLLSILLRADTAPHPAEVIEDLGDPPGFPRSVWCPEWRQPASAEPADKVVYKLLVVADLLLIGPLFSWGVTARWGIHSLAPSRRSPEGFAPARAVGMRPVHRR